MGLVLRADGRRADELRSLAMRRGVNRWAEGSCLIETGATQVLCIASVEEKVPAWMKGKATGWLTAEYSMLPRAGHERSPRESAGRPNSRSTEIRRLIGRALRPAVDLASLGERTVTLDCDVIQADGGTRTAAITGAWVALAEAMLLLMDRGELKSWPLRDHVAAVSAGLIEGTACLDLCYSEDHRADVDINVVCMGDGRLVEVQGTAEGEPFDRRTLDGLIDLCQSGAARLVAAQRESLGERLAKVEMR